MSYPVLIDGAWRESASEGSFRAMNPSNGEEIHGDYPVSGWADIDAALSASAEAAAVLRKTPTVEIAAFLTRFAERIEARAVEIVEMAHQETALPKSPRLLDVELPRTTGQLRKAAAAATDGSWALPTIDCKLNIRSYHAPIGPVFTIGPNNFPFAYNGISGGDFAAAIGGGNPVIAKAHPAHPGTTRLLAEEAFAALRESKLPRATVQLIYHTAPQHGTRCVADPRIGATGFTGSRAAGLALKAAADAAGKPIYLEMSSLNPVVILPGALAERGEKIAAEFADSCLAGAGQFCTKPGLAIVMEGPASEPFINAICGLFESRPAGTLLTAGVAKSLAKSITILRDAGAAILLGGNVIAGSGFRIANALLRVDGATFLKNAKALQTEAFGNASLIIVARDVLAARTIVESLDGQLTGSIYSDTQGSDDEAYAAIEPSLRHRVGRLLNDKMPTGVAVAPAMNHGGPYPATGHPGFTAVGIPASLRRFSQLECYDNVRQARLPALLRDKNPGSASRLIDGAWSRHDIST